MSAKSRRKSIFLDSELTIGAATTGQDPQCTHNCFGHSQHHWNLTVQLTALVAHALPDPVVVRQADRPVELLEAQGCFLLREFHAPHDHHSLSSLVGESQLDIGLDDTVPDAPRVVDKSLTGRFAGRQGASDGKAQGFNNGGSERACGVQEKNKVSSCWSLAAHEKRCRQRLDRKYTVIGTLLH